MDELSTRERIIESSAALFNTYGYHACSLSHIMEATGLKKGGIYNHFKNKDEIAVEAFNHNYQRVLRRFRETLDKVSTPTEKILAVVDVFVSFIDDPMVQGGGCPIFNTAIDSTNTHPALKEKARESIIILRNYIEIKLKEGISAGEVKSDVNIKQMATVIIATLEGAIVLSRVDGNKDSVEVTAEHMKKFITQSILI
ncbi:MAG TPA: TetR/AcrR family transcriptional regulator [Fulvivirga sp.]|nr:TetR/AcrR family transcriptional regulator [Fulvivirga sp.]